MIALFDTNNGSNTAVILLPVYAYKVAQNWQSYADDKKNIMCYNNIVYKWVRGRTHFDFGGGKIKEYDINDMDQIDLGYASTIHKSQGSEYKSVIINIQNAHYIMLNRPLIYSFAVFPRLIITLRSGFSTT